MAFKAVGKLKLVKDIQQISEKFKKREFVITMDSEGDYPQDIMFQSVNDKCDIASSFAVGSEVEVSFNLRGREWTSPQGEVKHFNTLDAWRVETPGADASAPAPAVIPEAQVPVTPPTAPAANDDLPF